VTPEQALQESKSGKLRPVYLVVGPEQYQQSLVVRALRDAALQGGTAGLNDDQWTAGEVGVDVVIGAARTLPMMAPRRWVLVRSLERWEPKGDAGKSADALDRLCEYAKNPSPSTVLVMTAAKLDSRRRLMQLAKKEGFAVGCEALSQHALTAWIEREARERGQRLGPGVAELIAELAGPELSSVADALERVCLYAGAESEVTEEAVGECIVKLRPASVWELVDAVGRRDLGGAMKALASVYDPSDRGLKLVGLLAWSARQLLRFQSAIGQKLSPAEAAKRAGAPPFKARELSAQARRVPRAALERWLETLSRVDLALKGGSKRPPRAVLEQAIVSMCSSGKAPSVLPVGPPDA
jgi:DNA polymerase III subunit delta